MRPLVLETSRLRLEPWEKRHAEMLVWLSSLPEVMRFIRAGEVWTRESAEDVAERRYSSTSARAS